MLYSLLSIEKYRISGMEKSKLIKDLYNPQIQQIIKVNTPKHNVFIYICNFIILKFSKKQIYQVFSDYAYLEHPKQTYNQESGNLKMIFWMLMSIYFYSITTHGIIMVQFFFKTSLLLKIKIVDTSYDLFSVTITNFFNTTAFFLLEILYDDGLTVNYWPTNVSASSHASSSVTSPDKNLSLHNCFNGPSAKSSVSGS
ncbi:hypothetical protein AGLY_006234 [Aphis glycines]|uniref:Uncharacterized protein n=1 Tax=Aphis glycines TaxID=307491 RepID=A0A6G0TST3_APHGL|nr:hypothetical protein AGLY_006234 [Aphis glycines]